MDISYPESVDAGKDTFPSEVSIREKMIQEAGILASMLETYSGIKKVGIAGSLARGKIKPSDIDFVIFVDNETAKACHKEKMKLIRSGTNKKVNLSKYVQMEDEDWNMFAAVYSSMQSKFDIQVVSDNPDEEYVKMVTRDNLDPDFVKNISKDVLIYDYPSGEFKKEKIYNEKQEELLDKASFERLKEIVTKPDKHYFETVIASHSHKKRIDRLKGIEAEPERNWQRIEISAKGEANEDRRKKYLDLIQSFSSTTDLSEKWRQVVDLAKSESLVDDESSQYYFEDLTQENFYEHIPLAELIKVGTRLVSAPTREDRYKILMEKTSGGELWYDIILGHVNDRMFEPVVDKLSQLDQKLEKGLDIGCGSGNSLKMIAPFLQSCTGLDNSDIALEAARNNDLPGNVDSLVRGDATDLRFDEGSFDLVVSNGLTVYLNTQEVRRYVHGVAKVLKQGGTYMETITYIDKDKILPKYEDEYLSSAKSVLICFLDNVCTNTNDIQKTENTISIILNEFKELGFEVKFSGIDENDLGLLEFYKR